MHSTSLLDNIVWHALVGPQARFAVGAGGVRRYAPGFSPIAGFEHPVSPDFDALTGLCAPGERVYTDGWAGAAPPGWRIDFETTMFKMVWNADVPGGADDMEAVRLTGGHAAQAVALADRTHPGPFGLRTIELGEYYGVFAGDRLVAMAGERFHVGPLREISGVCTDPAFQGRGLARALMLRLIRRQLGRGEVPCLHVVRENTRAHLLYRRMGFRDHRESPVRIISRTAD